MIAYWGIGTYWGQAQSNNKKGHLIGHVRPLRLFHLHRIYSDSKSDNLMIKPRIFFNHAAFTS